MTDQVTVTVDETVTDEERTAIRRALLMDSIRIVERLGRGIGGYAATSVEALTLKMARDMFPDLQLTREVWGALGGGVGATVQPARVAAWRAAVTGGPLPTITEPPPETAASPPAAPKPDDDEDEPDEEQVERTCECRECDGPECQGDCDSCDDCDCQQCHGDHEDHGDCQVCNERHEDDVCEQCGYCGLCDEHLDTDRYGDSYPGPCSQGHCHNCEHEC